MSLDAYSRSLIGGKKSPWCIFKLKIATKYCKLDSTGDGTLRTDQCISSQLILFTTNQGD